eukprot:Plantae.Rhodophyta-Hildenbrandia_rubra.ctg7453.p1 GENE.Plantae.Rhodophyta-Hildenbrandia_rubra.ctg7453~~Plantae.Rhodophyta-Hildenbrandia_rubra.ctg7453.p1  ORF type:complete len:281 (+),score=43.72 Plantae.Rhodophyta-Hildenbrandia_rubra.ctg7453:284-1126(+)
MAAFVPALPTVGARHCFNGRALCNSHHQHFHPNAFPRRSMTINTPKMAFSSIQGILTQDPVTVPGEPEDVIRAVYRQILGNAHLMEAERAELRTAESQFALVGDVRSFVRQVAKSDAYRIRFFENVSMFRFIELVYKHLLGRAVRSKQEYGTVMGVYREKGFEGVIDWILDSEEYEECFGNQIVPYGIFKGCYPTNEEFNRSVAMRNTPSSSDKARNAILQYSVPAGGSPNWLTISKGLPAGTERGTGFCIGGHWTSTQRNKRAPIRRGTKIPGGVVFLS